MRGERAIVAGLLVPGGVLLAFMAEAWPVTVDDAYISLRHARHWVELGSPSFDASVPVEAYSNFVWVVVGAASMALGGDPLFATKFLGAAAALATLPLAWGLVRRLGGSPGAALYAALLLGLSTGLGFWSVSGMETPLFALLLGFGVWWLCDERPRPGWAVAVLGLAALTRVEGPVLVGAAVLARAGVSLVEGRSLRKLAREYAWVALLAFAYVVYFAWRWNYYGHLFPSPIYFKRIGEAGELWSSYAALFVRGSWPILLVGLAAPWLAGARAAVPAAVVGAALLVFSSARVEVLDGVSTMAWFDRYFVPVLPCLCACVGLSVDALRRALAGSLPRRLAFAGVASFLLLWQFTNGNANPLGMIQRTRGYPPVVAERNVPSAIYLQERFGDDGTVVAGDVGLLGYVYRGTLWDLFGLASYDRTLRHDGALEPYLRELLDREPDAILLCFDASEEPERPCQSSERTLAGLTGFAAYERSAVFGREIAPSGHHVIFERRPATR